MLHPRLLRHTHVLRKGAVRHPLAGRSRSALLQHLVNLLKRKTLRLRDEEVREQERDTAQRSPEEEHLGAQVGVAFFGTDQVGGNNGNDAVPHPVRCGGETNTAGTDRDREDLTDHDPGCGTPGGSEEEDVNADERDHSRDGTGVVQALVVVGLASSNTDDTNNELCDNHAQRTPDEDGATAELLNHPEGEWGGADVHERGDQGDEEGVGDGAKGLEEHRAEVEDEVDTGKLLHHLHEDTDERSSDVAVALEDAALKAVGPATKVRSLRSQLLLVLVVGDDLGELVLDVVGVDGLATDIGERLSGLLELALLDVETGGFGEEEETRGEDDGPQKLDGDGDAVGAGVVAVLCGVDDAVGEQDTDGDAELVAGN